MLLWQCCEDDLLVVLLMFGSALMLLLLLGFLTPFAKNLKKRPFFDEKGKLF